MTSNHIFRLRRAILEALFEYESFQDLDTVLCNPALITLNPSPEEARVEWKNLIDYRMIVPLAGYAGAVCRLSADVRKIFEETRNAPRDPRLWGPGVC